MGLYEARGNLNKSLKDLLMRWQYTKTLWDDEQSKVLEEELLAKLEKDIRTATEAMDTMTLICGQAKRDVSA
jgi:hypothetical protein